MPPSPPRPRVSFAASFPRFDHSSPMSEKKKKKKMDQHCERKPFSKVQYAPSKAVSDEVDAGSSPKVRYLIPSDRPTSFPASLTRSFFGLIVAIFPHCMDREGKDCDDRPITLVGVLAWSVMVAISMYIVGQLLRVLFTDERLAVLAWVSAMMACVLFPCIVVLSGRINILDVGMASSFLLLFGCYERSFLGMLSMYLNTIYLAWVFGCVVSELRQHSGTEKSAEIALRCKEMKIKILNPVPPFILLCLLSVACVVKMLLICRMTPENPVSTLMDASFMVMVCMFAWTSFVNCVLLHYALFSEQIISMGFLNGFIVLFMLIFAVAFLFGEAVSSIVPWIGALATSGLYGYTYDVYNSYRVLMCQT